MKVSSREDLYYRLSVIPIEIPPSCERRDDIPLLADFFLRKYSQVRKDVRLDPEVLRILDVYAGG